MIYDVVIIGGGVVGLASALKIKEADPHLKVLLLEKENGLARHQTGNNSGVIHSGIYYKPGSAKANNCITGYRQLLEFCNRENIPYEICGKVIIATKIEEKPRLDNLFIRGLENGLSKIKKLGAGEIAEYEPNANGIAGIWVPYTGIIDYKDVCAKYAEIFTQKYQGEIFLNHKVQDIKVKKNIGEVITDKNNCSARLIVNTAGLYSDKIASLTRRINVRIIPFRGEYYEVTKEKCNLVNNLIYPVPDPAFPFLGVHFTRKLKGGIEAGPNAVFAFRKEGYHKTDIYLPELFESLFWRGFQKVMFKYWKMGLGEYYRSYNKIAFTRSLQRLLPEIKQNDLIPAGAGVRAQACTNDGNLIDDFLIYEDPNIINVLNAPSPAATASLSIGKTIADLVISRLN